MITGGQTENRISGKKKKKKHIFFFWEEEAWGRKRLPLHQKKKGLPTPKMRGDHIKEEKILTPAKKRKVQLEKKKRSERILGQVEGKA